MSRIVTYCDRKAKVMTVISFAKHGCGGWWWRGWWRRGWRWYPPPWPIPNIWAVQPSSLLNSFPTSFTLQNAHPPATPLIGEGSRILSRSLPLPVSFHTSAHRIFCWVFQWGQFLKRWSRVWVWYRHHQHVAVGVLFVHLRYWPVRQ